MADKSKLTKQTKLYLSPPAHATLKAHAAMNDKSMSETIEEVVNDVLKHELKGSK